MRLILYEMKKLVFVRSFLIILIMGFLVNGYFAISQVKMMDDQSEAYQNKREEIEAQLFGPLDNVKVSSIIAEYNRLKRIVDERSYSTGFSEDTYTGYTFSDYNLYEELYESLKYIYGYEEFAHGIIDDAYNNIEFYTQADNSYQIQYNEEIVSIYGDRKLNTYMSTRGWERYFKYQFSNLLIMFIVLYTISPIYSKEREESSSQILLTTKYGKTRVFLVKYISAIIIALVISLCFYIEDFLIFSNGFDFSGLNNPIYSIPFMEYCPHGGSIQSFLIMTLFMRLLAVVVIVSLYLTASAFTKRVIVSFILSFAFLIPIIIMNSRKILFNFIYLLQVQQYQNRLDFMSWFNKPYNYVQVSVVSSVVLICVLFVINYCIEVHFKKIFKRERV